VNFSGEFVNTIDAKWRASIPKEFRDLLESAGDDGLVLTKNQDQGITAFPPAEWETFTRGIEGHSNALERTLMNRLYIAPKSVVKFDAQGRIPLTKALRLWAGIGEEEREIVVVGNFRRIDIFSQSRYDAVVSKAVDLLQQNRSVVEALNLP
jgi:MraZ protein